MALPGRKLAANIDPLRKIRGRLKVVFQMDAAVIVAMSDTRPVDPSQQVVHLKDYKNNYFSQGNRSTGAKVVAKRFRALVFQRFPKGSREMYFENK
jgi:hypothetical protein